MTLKLVYEPKIQEELIEFNPLCSDNKFHIRFKSYNKPEMIYGVEGKLTFLLTLLFNREFSYWGTTKEDDKITSGNFNKYLWDKYIPTFMETDSFKNVQDALEQTFASGEILLTPRYTKKGYTNPWGQFGEVPREIYAGINSGDRLDGSATLDQFLESFNINLVSFLFNDAYYLAIEGATDALKINQKFVNRNNRKTKLKKKKITTINLW